MRYMRVQQFPLAAGEVKVRPAPLLQTHPFKDVYLLKQGENERLDSGRLGRQSGRHSNTYRNQVRRNWPH